MIFSYSLFLQNSLADPVADLIILFKVFFTISVLKVIKLLFVILLVISKHTKYVKQPYAINQERWELWKILTSLLKSACSTIKVFLDLA